MRNRSSDVVILATFFYLGIGLLTAPHFMPVPYSDVFTTFGLLAMILGANYWFYRKIDKRIEAVAGYSEDMRRAGIEAVTTVSYHSIDKICALIMPSRDVNIILPSEAGAEQLLVLTEYLVDRANNTRVRMVIGRDMITEPPKRRSGGLSTNRARALVDGLLGLETGQVEVKFIDGLVASSVIIADYHTAVFMPSDSRERECLALLTSHRSELSHAYSELFSSLWERASDLQHP